MRILLFTIAKFFFKFGQSISKVYWVDIHPIIQPYVGCNCSKVFDNFSFRVAIPVRNGEKLKVYDGYVKRLSVNCEPTYLHPPSMPRW